MMRLDVLYGYAAIEQKQAIEATIDHVVKLSSACAHAGISMHDASSAIASLSRALAANEQRQVVGDAATVLPDVAPAATTGRRRIVLDGA